jgi:hypothetical protein
LGVTVAGEARLVSRINSYVRMAISELLVASYGCGTIGVRAELHCRTGRAALHAVRKSERAAEKLVRISEHYVLRILLNQFQFGQGDHRCIALAIREVFDAAYNHGRGTNARSL